MRRCDSGEWAKFKRYHYLTAELPHQSICYGCYDKNKIVGFIAVIHFPHPQNKRIKTISRLCVLPDYQGCGIGKKFLTEVAKIYAAKGYEVKITTSAKNLIIALNKDINWALVRYSRCKKSPTAIDNKTRRDKCKTASFFFQNR